MPVRRFLVMFDSFPIDKASVKSGQNSPEVVTACRCVNVGLFVSGDLRRDVIVSIAVGNEEDLKVVSFPGNSLRRVSPDERSISFFMLKAIEKAQDLEFGKSLTMNNRIELVRASLKDLVDLWDSHVIQVPSNNPERFILDTNLSADRIENTP
jgi:tRNA pseudouridine-54 N-methylase